MLAPLTSWLTPGSLFLLLNIVIGTIYLTSRFTSTRHPQPQPQPGPEYPPPLARSPSLLQRVKSIDFSFHKYNQPNQDPPINNPPDQYTTPPPFERKPSRFSTNSHDPNPDEAPGPEFQPPARTRSILERVKSIDFASFYRSDSIKTESDSDSVPDPIQEPDHVIRTRSENPVTQRRIPETMKRSVSENWEKEDEEIEEIERIRPATTRIERTVSIGEGVDVDLKADHFINKFKQQLKLQRLDSLLRYKEMIMGKK